MDRHVPPPGVDGRERLDVPLSCSGCFINIIDTVDRAILVTRSTHRRLTTLLPDALLLF
jgi:hypothetical protein